MWLVVLSGCGLVLDLEPTPEDGSVIDASATDAATPPDAATPRDADNDEGGPLADAAPSECTIRPLTGELLALYTFDDDLTDAVGAAPDGVAVPPYALDDIGAGCGKVLTFYPRDAPDTGYAYLPPDSVWRQAEGSIDLMIRVDEHIRTAAGVLSRDAMGVDGGGHFTLLVTESGQLGIRLQSEVGDRYALCSNAPIPLGVWLHVGVHFGPVARLFIDGVQQTYDGTLGSGDGVILLNCMGDALSSHPLDENDEPWVIGAASWRSTTGSPTPISAPLVGAIDHLRFWGTIVDFTAP